MCKTGDNLLKAAAIGGAGYFGGPLLMEGLGGLGGAAAGEAAGAGLGEAGAAAAESGALPGAIEGFSGMSLAPDPMALSGGLSSAGGTGITASFNPAVAEFGSSLGSPASFGAPQGGGGITTAPLPPTASAAAPTAAFTPSSFAQGLPGAESIGMPASVSPVGGGAMDATALGSGGASAAPSFSGMPADAAPPATTDPLASPPGFNVPPLEAAGAPGATAAPNSTVQKALDLLGKNGWNAANLGLAGLSISRQQHGGDAAQRQLGQIAAPATAVEQSLLSNFQKGQVSGADAFAINQFAQKQKAQVSAYYAKAGLSNSSMHQQAMQEIDKQAEGMRQQALQNMLSGGLKAAGVSSPILQAGVSASMSSDAAATAAMRQFFDTMARMNTPQASQTGAQ